MSGGRNFADWLLGWAHRVPHFDFRFRRLRHETPFDVDPNGEYAQSLVVLCAFCLVLSLLFLLATVIVWVAQCCVARRSSTPNRTSRRRIGRLSLALFLCSVFCFTCMGVCLFGNEQLNKGVQSSLDGLAHLGDGFRRAIIQTQKLNQTQWQLSQHVDELTVLIEQKSREHRQINQTLIRNVDALLTELSDKVDELKQRLVRMSAILADTHFLESSKRKGERVEFERWLLCLLLQLIMCAVLFAGVIAFCRQSRKGAIIFSGLGLVIFLVSWLLFSIVFPLTVAHADFCSDGRPFLRTRLNDELLDLVHFYTNCSPEDGLPSALPLAVLGQLAQEQASAEHRLDTALARMFNASADLDQLGRQCQSQVLASMRHLGALQFGLQCGHLHREVHGMRHGFCRHAFIGTTLIAAGLLLLGLALFILLLFVAKSWYAFTRLPNDYLEVGEEDQFSPRCHDAMPDNIYDTNIFNPRARQHLSGAGGGTEIGAAGTTTNGGGGGGNRMPGQQNGMNGGNGGAGQQLLLGGTGTEHMSWQQQMLAHNAALATAPPAGGTLRIGGNGTLGRNGCLRTASGNYQQLNGGTLNPYGRFQEFGDA